MEKGFKIFLLVILYVYGAVRMPYMKNRDKIKYVKNICVLRNLGLVFCALSGRSSAW